MITETVGYASADGSSVIDSRLWMPDGAEPKAIVQIVHGMSEHIDRYAEFAEFLTGLGYGVCAESHIGHGKSAAASEDLGHMPPDGKDILIADVHRLRTSVSEIYEDVPYFMFGHSMGSYIVRVYLARHGKGLAGAVLCGTGNQPRAVSAAGRAFASALCKAKGSRYRSKLLDSMGAGAFGRGIEGARTPLDWLSTDPMVVDAYLADEMCGQLFTVGAYATLLDLTEEAVSQACAKAYPPELPLLYIGGEEDPVGDFGKGVIAAADLAERTGSYDVEDIIYEGMRHEILNEPGRRVVYNDIADWLDDIMAERARFGV